MLLFGRQPQSNNSNTTNNNFFPRKQVETRSSWQEVQIEALTTRMSFVRSFLSAKRRRTDAVSETATDSQQSLDISQPGPSRIFSQICHKPERLLKPESMRMVVIQEDRMNVIFDTAGVVPVDKEKERLRAKNSTSSRASPLTPPLRLSPCRKFIFLPKMKDSHSLSTMVFGAMPSSTGSDSFKIHTLADHNNQVMVSRVLLVPKVLNNIRRRMSARTAAESVPSDSDCNYQSTVRSLDGLRCSKSMCITAPPERFTRVRNSSLHLDGEAEDDFRAFSPPHSLSKSRRIQMSNRANLCHEGGAVRWKSRSRLSSSSSQVEDDNSRRLGVAVIWDQSERHFLFQHITLIEAEMTKLEQKVEAACQNTTEFLSLVYDAWTEFLDAVMILANSPRLKQPVWLSLLEKADLRKTAFPDEDVCQTFCDNLARLAVKLDNKHNQYFLSNLISAVLMHHMSWVASVASPVHRPQPNTQHKKRKDYVIGGSLADEALMAPYNVHMAQYLEVVGSVGASGRCAKTIVTGKEEDVETILTLLHILSYFIRCSSIRHNKDDDRFNDLPLEEAFSPVSASPCASLATSPRPVLFTCAPPSTDEDDEMASSVDSVGLENSGRGREETLTASSAGAGSQPQPIVNSQHHAHHSQQSNGVSCSTSSSIPSSTSLNGKRARRASMDMPPPHLPDEDVARPLSLGRSLLAGTTSSYSPHFVLSGLLKTKDMTDTFSRMMDEVRTGAPADEGMSGNSLVSSQSSNNSDMWINQESVIILADTDDNTVRVLSPDGCDLVHSPSDVVVSMLEQFVELHQLGLAPEFLLTQIEDTLSDVLAKSLSLVEMVSSGATSTLPLISPTSDPSESESHHEMTLSPERVRSIVGCDHSDLRLILNVAAVYYPGVLESVS